MSSIEFEKSGARSYTETEIGAHKNKILDKGVDPKSEEYHYQSTKYWTGEG